MCVCVFFVYYLEIKNERKRGKQIDRQKKKRGKGEASQERGKKEAPGFFVCVCECV